MRRVWRLFGIGLVCSAVSSVGGCSGGGTNAGTASMNWGCGEEVEIATKALVSCQCHALHPGSAYAIGSGSSTTSITAVKACAAYSCCLLVDAGYDSTCSCENFAATCDAEAASRPGTRVVATCPPGSSPPPPACSVSAENCSASYLQQKGYSGCCTGLTCAADANGVMTCQ